ncbi:MAG: YiaA/YiaB family inner membrane protein [Pseudomonadota bacterium]
MLDHSKTWINFNYLCVALAYGMLGASLFLMPVNLATKGYLGMGIIFLSGSLVTLVKTLHDLRIQTDVTTKIERAKQDKLLQEFVAQN